MAKLANPLEYRRAKEIVDISGSFRSWHNFIFPRSDSWSKMDETMDAISKYDNIAIRSGHGVSKSFILARAGLWFLFNFAPSKVIMTAPTQRQTRDVLWAEVDKAYREAGSKLGGHKTLQRLEITADWFLEAFKSEDYDVNAFAGFHSENVMIIMDEACGIAKDIWSAAGGIKTGKVVRHIVAGQPHDATSEFAKCFQSPGWHKIHISSLESPNITGECKIEGLADEKWVEDRIKDGWTKDSQLYRVRVLGEFPVEGSANTLIPLSHIQGAIERRRGVSSPLVMGIDVARFGDDSTVFDIMDETGCEVKIDEEVKIDTMSVVGKAVNLINEYNIALVGVDVIGVGAGVYDRLRELYPYGKVVPVNVGVAAEGIKWRYARKVSEMKYLNLRAELFWLLKSSMDILCLLDVGRTVADLSDIRYKFRSDGVLQIEKKSDAKKRTGRSFDFADARIIALYAASKLNSHITRGRERYAPSKAISGLV